MKSVNDIPSLAEKVLFFYSRHVKSSAFTIAISGVDASGKGYTSALLQKTLEKKGFKVANINIDPWQHPINIRLDRNNPAENFYNNVFRWDDVFDQLLIPLKEDRGIHLKTKLIRTDTDEYFPFTYNYNEIDFLLVDAIFLLQPKYISFFDLKIWIDCSFETALERAIARNAEGLPVDQLIADYHTYYYPAQQYHIKKDNPKQVADIIFNND